MATVPGTQTADTLQGTPAADTLFGYRGADLILGNGGNDRAYGGQDADTLFGGQGADTLSGDLGDDLLFGNLGTDLLFGNQGNDTLYGGQGNDTLYGGQGDDLLYGDLGDNTLYGDAGFDTAVFRGRRSDYVIQDIGGGVTTVRRDGSTTRVSSVEFFRFDDDTVAVGDLFSDGSGGGGGGAPPNRAPSQPTDTNDASNRVAEGAAAGTGVGITATSADPEGQAVTFSLVGDTSGGGFQVNAGTGVVTIADSSRIDYETAPGNRYSLTVQASDGRLTSQQTFTIGVTDVAPSVPVDSDTATANRVIRGRTERGTYTGLTASSTDVNGPAVTFSLVGDTSNGGFEVDPATGRVTVTGATNFLPQSEDDELVDSYSVTVQATDGLLSARQTFTIDAEYMGLAQADSFTIQYPEATEQPTIVNVLENDYSPDPDSLQVSRIFLDGEAPYTTGPKLTVDGKDYALTVDSRSEDYSARLSGTLNGASLTLDILRNGDVSYNIPYVSGDVSLIFYYSITDSTGVASQNPTLVTFTSSPDTI